MNDLFADQDVDQLVWSVVSSSTNSNDFLNFIKHGFNRQVDHEQAFQLAIRHEQSTESASLFPFAIEKLTEQALAGNTTACFHLARWHRLGIGTNTNMAQALDWYQCGIDLGSSRCMIAKARTIATDDPKVAVELLTQALELGDISAHCFLADFDKPRHDELLELGAQSQDGFAVYQWGCHLLKTSKSEEARSRSIEILSRAAKLGDAYACNLLVWGYLYGSYEVTKDKETAIYWARQGIKLGSESSYSLLGRAIIGDSDTEDEGIAAWRRASMLGDEFAQCALGWRFVMYGDSIEVQHEGIRWLREAVKQGNMMAIYRLSEFLKDGRGVEKNEQEAVELLKRGAKLGSAECQASLAIAYMFGDQVEVDKEHAHNLLQLSRLQGSVWGTYLLGMTYEEGDGVPKSIEKAVECFKEVVDEEPRAAFRMGYLSLWGDEDNPDPAAAAKWFMSAAERGNADAQLHLGIMLLRGYGVEESPSKALKWYKLSAEQGNRSANRELGLLYAEGNGVGMDRELGMRYIAKAASMGDEASKKWLDENCPKKPQWLLEMRSG